MADMRAYDELPPAVRRALQDAPIPLGMQSARRLLYRYDEQETAMTIAEFVKHGMTDGNEEWGTRHSWTYTIRREGWLWKGLHEGKDHPQADKHYPWPSYQLTPRNTTRVVEYYTRKKP